MQWDAVEPVELRVDEVESQLGIWAEKLDALAARNRGAGGQIGMLGRSHVEDMKSSLATLQSAYYVLRARHYRDWQYFEKEFAIGWNNLAAALRELDI